MNTNRTIVLDTNAALDALLFNDSRIALLMQHLAAKELRWIGCPAMRAELADVLARPALQKHAPNHAALMAQFDVLVAMQPEPAPLAGATGATGVVGALSTLRCRDADDQVFIDLALQHHATWLITRDRDLLCLARSAKGLGLAILVPEAWQPSGA